ncbi:MAG: hypothetical protein AB7J40_03255 [Candidatus Altimarinota bacterium]
MSQKPIQNNSEENRLEQSPAFGKIHEKVFRERMGLQFSELLKKYVNDRQDQDLWREVWLQTVTAHKRIMEEFPVLKKDAIQVFYTLICDEKGSYDADTVKVLLLGELENKRQKQLQNPNVQIQEKMRPMFEQIKKHFSDFQKYFLDIQREHKDRIEKLKQEPLPVVAEVKKKIEKIVEVQPSKPVQTPTESSTPQPLLLTTSAQEPKSVEPTDAPDEPLFVGSDESYPFLLDIDEDEEVGVELSEVSDDEDSQEDESNEAPEDEYTAARTFLDELDDKDTQINTFMDSDSSDSTEMPSTFMDLVEKIASRLNDDNIPSPPPPTNPVEERAGKVTIEDIDSFKKKA